MARTETTDQKGARLARSGAVTRHTGWRTGHGDPIRYEVTKLIWDVEGDTDTHRVRLSAETGWSCSCPATVPHCSHLAAVAIAEYEGIARDIVTGDTATSVLTEINAAEEQRTARRARQDAEMRADTSDPFDGL